MKTRQTFRFLAIITLCIVVSSCMAVTTYKAYNASLLGPSQSAIVTCDSSVDISRIDDREVSIYSYGGLWYRGCAISLLPGKHTIVARFYVSANHFEAYTSNVAYEINAKPGEVYRFRTTGQGRIWLEKADGPLAVKYRRKAMAMLSKLKK